MLSLLKEKLDPSETLSPFSKYLFFMPLKLKIINPLDFEGWDDMVLSANEYSFFHSSAWAKTLNETYKYKPYYFSLFDKNELKALVPLMEINSFLTGRRGVSLPFSDWCEPIINEEIMIKDLLNNITDYGKKSGWKYIEFRPGRKFPRELRASASFYHHILDLQEGEHQIFFKFRDSTRRNIKKAIREGVQVKICHSVESIREFYRLNCITRKYHGLPTQSYDFFKKIHEHIISQKKGFVALASYLKRNIAGAVYFHFGEKALFKYGAFDRRYQHLRPNNLVMWEAIKWYARNGFKSISFGRTELKNEGLLQFKRGWGTSEEIINYYKYDLGKDAFVKGPHSPLIFYWFLKKMPSPILNLIGLLFYRHVG